MTDVLRIDSLGQVYFHGALVGLTDPQWIAAETNWDRTYSESQGRYFTHSPETRVSFSMLQPPPPPPPKPKRTVARSLGLRTPRG